MGLKIDGIWFYHRSAGWIINGICSGNRRGFFADLFVLNGLEEAQNIKGVGTDRKFGEMNKSII